MALDAKLRTTIVEGISVFMSLFDQPDVAGVFCPPPPDEAVPGQNDVAVPPLPGLRRRLPPLADLIEDGKVLALNMRAGANPALARAIGVLLKNAWMQALIHRPAEAARRPERQMRPAVFICDEYQAFATVGQDHSRCQRCPARWTGGFTSRRARARSRDRTPDRSHSEAPLVQHP